VRIGRWDDVLAKREGIFRLNQQSREQRSVRRAASRRRCCDIEAAVGRVTADSRAELVMSRMLSAAANARLVTALVNLTGFHVAGSQPRHTDSRPQRM